MAAAMVAYMKINLRELMLIKDRRIMCNWCKVLYGQDSRCLYDRCKEQGGKCLIKQKFNLGGFENDKNNKYEMERCTTKDSEALRV